MTKTVWMLGAREMRNNDGLLITSMGVNIVLAILLTITTNAYATIGSNNDAFRNISDEEYEI